MSETERLAREDFCGNLLWIVDIDVGEKIT